MFDGASARFFASFAALASSSAVLRRRVANGRARAESPRSAKTRRKTRVSRLSVRRSRCLGLRFLGHGEQREGDGVALGRSPVGGFPGTLDWDSQCHFGLFKHALDWNEWSFKLACSGGGLLADSIIPIWKQRIHRQIERIK